MAFHYVQHLLILRAEFNPSYHQGWGRLPKSLLGTMNLLELADWFSEACPLYLQLAAAAQAAGIAIFSLSHCWATKR